MFRLAHVTDPHFRSFAGAQLSDFFNKRAVGTVNLMINRRRKHRMELLEALREDLRARAVDHLALTGDLSNVSLPSEFEAARRWIEELGAPASNVTVIPGNHDAYIDEVASSGMFERLFGAYQRGDAEGESPSAAAGEPYPFVRLRGGVAIIGVNTCVATHDLGAWGRIGPAQLDRLENLLLRPDVKQRVRVVLIHHPPVVHRPPESRNLRDRDALLALLARTGAELVLHGHDHRDLRVTLAGPAGVAIPVVGAGSASYAGRPERRSRYNIYEIDGRRITALTYAHDEPSGRYVEAHREVLA